MQHGLALLEQRCDLLGLEAERLPLHAPGDECRAAGAEQERDRGRDEEHRQDREELVADVPLEHADGHHPDDASVRVAQRHLGARRAAQAAGLRADELMTREDGRDRLARVVGE